jgi:hypothetical protein
VKLLDFARTKGNLTMQSPVVRNVVVKRPINQTRIVIPGLLHWSFLTHKMKPRTQISSSRANSVWESIASVQEFRPKTPHVPLWKKISTWFLVLTPAMAITIFIGGFFYFWLHQDIGINAYLPANAATVVNGISVPDHTGTFLQTESDPQMQLKEILQYNGRQLEPPETSQVILKPDELKYILIRQSQVNDPDQYQLYYIEDGHGDVLVPMVAEHVPATRIALIALHTANEQVLKPGHYMVYIPDLDSGFYWSFFTIGS